MAMKLVTLVAGLAAAAPFSYNPPLPDGFPNASNDTIYGSLGTIAGGTLGSGPSPPSIDNQTVDSWRLIAFEGFMEVAFFVELISNITNNVPGYDKLEADDKEYVLNALRHMQGQEEIHTLASNDVILHQYNIDPILPCEYNFPVEDFQSALAFAQTFSIVYGGLIQDMAFTTANHNGPGHGLFEFAYAQYLGTKGQQDGWFRSRLGLRPSGGPFITQVAQDYGFTSIQQTVVPGSCGNIEVINLKTFEPLTLLTKNVTDGSIQLQAVETDKATVDPANQKLVYVNGPNLPLSVDFTVVSKDGPTVTIQADFPHDSYVFDGLTTAAIANNGAPPYQGPDDVAAVTVFGAAYIQVN